jgi:hypothetical protein
MDNLKQKVRVMHGRLRQPAALFSVGPPIAGDTFFESKQLVV